MDSTKHPETKAKGKGLLSQVMSFDFVCSMEIAHPILQLILKVSRALQDPKINLTTALNEVRHLQKAPREMKQDGTVFKKMFAEASSICEMNEIEIPEVRRRKVSKRFDQNWANECFYATKEEEFCVGVFFPMLDSCVRGIEERFTQETFELVCAVQNLLGLSASDEQISLICSFLR